MTDSPNADQEHRELMETIIDAYETIESSIAMTDFLDTLTSSSPVGKILELADDRIREVLPFHTVAFYLLDEETGDLRLRSCRPAQETALMEQLIAREVESGNVHIALRDQRPMLRHVDTKNNDRLILHAVSTSRRCRGLFAGLYRHGRGHGDRLSLLLLTLILSHCANALESAALYGMVQRSNRTLTGTVEQNRLRFQKINRGVDELLRLVQFMLRRDPATSPEESATRLMFLRNVYNMFTNSGAPELEDIAKILTTIAEHYRLIFALPSAAIQFQVEGDQALISLERGIPAALALFELLALCFHRKGPEHDALLTLDLTLEKENKQARLRAESGTELPDPESEEGRMLRFLLQEELQGTLKYHRDDERHGITIVFPC